MQLDLDGSNLGQVELSICELPASSIGITEGVIAVPTLETWIAWGLSSLDPTNERFHGLVQTEQDILQDMAADLLILWTDALLDLDEITFLLIHADGLARLRVGFTPFLQVRVIQLATPRKYPFKLRLGGLIGIEAVFERFEHAFVLLFVSSHTVGVSRPLPD
jgi:hypothetical protein